MSIYIMIYLFNITCLLSNYYSVILKDGKRITKPSSDLKVGDIIEVRALQRIPADLILLYSS